MANLIATQAKMQQTYPVYFDSDEPHLVRFPISTSSSTSTFSPASSYTSLHATSQSSTSTAPSTPGQSHTGFKIREHSSQCKILPAQDFDTESPFVNSDQLSLSMRQSHGLCSTDTGTKSGGVCNDTLHQRAAIYYQPGLDDNILYMDSSIFTKGVRNMTKLALKHTTT